MCIQRIREDDAATQPILFARSILSHLILCTPQHKPRGATQRKSWTAMAALSETWPGLCDLLKLQLCFGACC